MPGRPKNPPPDRRKEILEAALRTFGRKGYAAATNADIAREAGVTAAALYYYFPSKADLFKAALTERSAMLKPILAQVREQLAALPPQLVLSAVVDTMTGFLSEERTVALISILLSEGPRSPELVELWQSQFVAPASSILFEYIRVQVERGTIRPIDPRTLFLMMGGPIISGTIMRDLVKLPVMEGLDTQALADRIKEVVLPALLIQPGTSSD